MIQVSRNTVYEKMSNGLKLAFAMLNDKLLFVKIESYGIFLWHQFEQLLKICRSSDLNKGRPVVSLLGNPLAV